jgi:hypothetical protein
MKSIENQALLTSIPAQMDDWEERDKSWKKFRGVVEQRKTSKRAKTFGLARRQ